MRVLLVGATAHLASTLIPALLASPYIHHLVLLSRVSIRSAKILSNDKITQLLYPDLSALEAEVFETLRDTHRIQAVVWLVGGAITRFPSFDAAQEANVSIPLGFLEKCITHGLVPTPAGMKTSSTLAPPVPAEHGKKKRYADTSAKSPFRFVYMSTYNASQDQFASLWTAGKFRKMKGAAEKSLLGLADEKGQGMLEVYCLRLGKVLDGGQTVANVLREGAGGCLSDAQVASKVLDLCVGGRGDAKYGGPEGSGVLELEEIMGDHWADINSVTANG